MHLGYPVATGPELKVRQLERQHRANFLSLSCLSCLRRIPSPSLFAPCHEQLSIIYHDYCSSFARSTPCKRRPLALSRLAHFLSHDTFPSDFLKIVSGPPTRVPLKSNQPRFLGCLPLPSFAINGPKVTLASTIVSPALPLSTLASLHRQSFPSDPDG